MLKESGVWRDMLDISKMKYLNSGECADIYEVDPCTVLKLGKPGWSKEMLYQEYVSAKLIADSGIPAPKVYESVEINGQYGYTMDKLQGVTIADLLWKYPWRIVTYSKQLAAVHAQIHRAEAPEELPVLAERYGSFISEKRDISDERKQQLLRALERLNEPGRNRICHGDFHAMNVLADGAAYAVIDWVLAARGDAAADVAGTYLITRIYSRYSRGKNAFVRLAGALGGRVCAEIYLKEYIAITKMDKKRILEWIPVKAATYIDVGLPKPMEQAFQRILEAEYQ